jgi:hypothetical protein
LVDDNDGWRWPVTWSRVVAKSEVEQKRCGRRKGKGSEPSTAPDKVHPGMGISDDRR